MDLHPAGFIASGAYATSGSQQVGFATTFTGTTHAALWSGTAGSFVDLNPVRSSESKALGISGGWQVGYAQFGDWPRAGIWRGTAESWVDLSLFLDGPWSYSTATAIWSDGFFIYVGGAGLRPGEFVQALLWTRPICYADLDGNGSLDLFDFLTFVNLFNQGGPAADCDQDGAWTLFDFLCFTNAFNAGC